LTVLVSILLIAVVLVQKSKGGGLSSSFAGGNQVLGVRSTNSFIEKATWTLAAIIVVLSVLSSFATQKTSGDAPRATVETAAPATDSNQYATPAAEEKPAAAPAAAQEATPAASEEAAPVAPAEAPAE
jgi:preprotein translocase subunit SecG